MPTAIYPGDDVKTTPMQYYPNGHAHTYPTAQYAFPPGMGPTLPYAGAAPTGPGMGSNFHPGRAYESLGYDYQLPSRGYAAENSWSGWDLAQAHYGGRDPGFDRGWFDGILGGLSSFFSSRRMRYDDAKDAHRRIYHHKEYQSRGWDDISSRILGGAAAFQAFLIWDKEHFNVYHERPSQENRERLISLAVGELYSLYERLGLLPTTRTATHTLRLDESAEAAAATAKYLYDRHYDPDEGVYSRYGGDGSTSLRHRRSGSFAGGDHEYGRSRRGHRRHGSDSGREREREREEEMMRRDQMSQMSGGGMGSMGMGGMGMSHMQGGNPMGMGMRGGGPGMMSPYGMRSPMSAPAGMMNPMMGSGGGYMGGMNPMMQQQMMGGGPQQFEQMMMGQHSQMHGQAMPGMTPEMAHRMEGEGPIPGTRTYYDMLAMQNGMGGGMAGMEGMSGGMGGMSGGMGHVGSMMPGMGGTYGGQMMQAGYGAPRSWYGRQ